MLMSAQYSSKTEQFYIRSLNMFSFLKIQNKLYWHKLYWLTCNSLTNWRVYLFIFLKEMILANYLIFML